VADALDPAESAKLELLDSDMRRTFNYVWRRGVLLILFIQPIYDVLEGLREYISEESAPSNRTVVELPFRIPLGMFWSLTLYKVRVASVDGEFEFTLHPWWWLEYLLGKFPRAKRALGVPLAAPGSWVARRLGLPVGSRIATPAERIKFFLLILMLWMGTVVALLPFNIIRSLGWVLFRGIAVTMRSALRPIPALLAILFVVFATGDSWRVFGEEPYWRFVALIAILLAVSLAAMAANLLGARNGWRSILECELAGDQALKEWATRTPARAFSATVAPVSPFDGPFIESRDQAAMAEMPLALTATRQLLGMNITVIFWITMALNVISITFWISLLFILVGAVAISSDVTNGLLGGSTQHSAVVAVTPPLHLFGQQFLITRQLLLLSVVLGAIAALNFATSTLQNSDDLEAFAHHALRDLRRALAALAFYLGAVAALLVELNENGALQRLKDMNQGDLAKIAKLLESPAGVPLSSDDDSPRSTG
jgi:hypothetical protein